MTAATDNVFGVITDGETTQGHDSIAVSHAYGGIVDVKVSATSAEIAAGDILELAADGTVNAPSGTTGKIQVAQAMEDGESEELIMAVLIPPVTIA
ncbi:MAG: hypothetical protein JW739_05680 [Opitutales bacterium]|nr:hypothetical protein [Opitutales bacterium]